MYPVINKKLCVECGACIDECEKSVFGINEVGAYVASPENCTGCGNCDDYCLQGAITFES
jgi:NAD-dependent dihydropyrimidine dehydrogenase PreA subunit